MNIRIKIIFLFIAITASTLLLLSISVYLFSSHFASNNFYIRLKARASIAARKHLEKDENAIPVFDEVRKKYLLPLEGETEYFIKVQPGTRKIQDTAAPKLPDLFYAEIFRNAYAEYKEENFYYVGLYYKDTLPGYIILMKARDLEGEELLFSLRYLLFIGVVVSSVVVFVASIVFSNQVINPISKIIKEVNLISATNLHRRLEPNDGRDELSSLAITFNQMLDRLESSFEMQSNFVSNASHELRTPLTTILGESEIMLRKSRTQEEYINALTIINHEANRLEQLITSLLKLSQLGFDGKKLITEQVRIDELLMAIKADVNRRIPDNQVSVEWESIPEQTELISLSVNRMWMKLAIINIIHNAIKYSNNQPVQVRLSVNKELLEISITDKGIGIPAEDIVHVFEPFYRGGNAVNYAGYGIGLPLSLKIIRLHNGTISIRSEKDQGTTVSIYFKME